MSNKGSSLVKNYRAKTHHTYINNVLSHNNIIYIPKWALKLDWTKDHEMFFEQQVCTGSSSSSNRYFPFLMSMSHYYSTHLKDQHSRTTWQTYEQTEMYLIASVSGLKCIK